mmetsp:Transcript_38988/g.28836  ORF Transcript_38988/g.28836 Transcript_38988/m.28836 type:complete len:101 (+) Transcript_38988:704-1006(+)
MNNPMLLGKTYARDFVDNPKTDIFLTSFSTGLDVDTTPRTSKTQEEMRLSIEKQVGSKIYNVINGVKYCMNANSRQCVMVTAEAFAFEDFWRFSPYEIAD